MLQLEACAMLQLEQSVMFQLEHSAVVPRGEAACAAGAKERKGQSTDWDRVVGLKSMMTSKMRSGSASTMPSALSSRGSSGPPCEAPHAAKGGHAAYFENQGESREGCEHAKGSLSGQC